MLAASLLLDLAGLVLELLVFLGAPAARVRQLRLETLQFVGLGLLGLLLLLDALLELVLLLDDGLLKTLGLLGKRLLLAFDGLHLLL